MDRTIHPELSGWLRMQGIGRLKWVKDRTEDHPRAANMAEAMVYLSPDVCLGVDMLTGRAEDKPSVRFYLAMGSGTIYQTTAHTSVVDLCEALAASTDPDAEAAAETLALTLQATGAHGWARHQPTVSAFVARFAPGAGQEAQARATWGDEDDPEDD